MSKRIKSQSNEGKALANYTSTHTYNDHELQGRYTTSDPSKPINEPIGAYINFSISKLEPD